MSKIKKIAIVGIQGVPARYGGFETLVENIIGNHQSAHVAYTIFCSSKDTKSRMPSYKGAKLKYVHLHANGIQSIPYDIISLIRSIRGYDTILVLGVSGCLFLPIFRLFCHKRLIVNIDGLEHRRKKWNWAARWVLKKSEAMAVRFADAIITDNKGIQDYVTEEYRKQSHMIAYGGNHVKTTVSAQKETEILNKYNVQKNTYALSICRIEPENNCHLTLEAFKRKGEPLFFIGNWQRSSYSRHLRKTYEECPNIHFIDSLYDLKELFVLRSNCKYYIHGHSAGGTNPSLVEAMFFQSPILAFDVVYNRETTENKAFYFSSVDDLTNLLSRPYRDFSTNANCMQEIASRCYTWEQITRQYEELY